MGNRTRERLLHNSKIGFKNSEENLSEPYAVTANMQKREFAYDSILCNYFFLIFVNYIFHIPDE